MKKRIIALILCLTAAVSVLAGCAGSIDADSEYKGEQVVMYLTENIYNLDPAYAYSNEASRSVVSLLFDTLFVLNGNGEVKPSLAKSYKTETTKDGKHFMYIEINEGARWSDNQPVTADDVVYAWKRLLNPNNAFSSAYLLFDIKNARAYNSAEVSKDDIGLTADNKLLTIEFESAPNTDQFLLNLTSLALAPLREDIASKGDDWAKKPGIMTASGPFKLSKVGFFQNGEVKYEDINYSVKKVDENNKVVLDKNGNPVYLDATVADNFAEQQVSSYILERNMYYYRDAEEGEKLDKSVTPYRILVDFSFTDEEILEAYNNGVITYVGDIPMSIRESVDTDLKDSLSKKDSLSTNVLYLNQNADVTHTKTDGTTETVKLFANVKVRQALSLAVNRDEIAKTLVFAQKATGLVPTGVFETTSAKTLFRDKVSSEYEFLSHDSTKAASLLKEAGITPSEYAFTVKVAAYDDVHMAVAEAVVSSWNALGFNVTLEARGTVANNDFHKDVAGVPSDLCDDLWAEDIRNGQYDVAVIDLVALSADAFSVLAPFAKEFAGQQMDMSNPEDYKLAPHATGYDSEEYNTLIEKIYGNISGNSADLYTAESMLMTDLPVIPIVFNQTAYLLNDDLIALNDKSLFSDSTEYCTPAVFDKLTVKNYESYELKCAEYVFAHYDEWKTRSNSYVALNFAGVDKETFVYTNSNYYYLFKDKYGVDKYDWLPAKPEKKN